MDLITALYSGTGLITLMAFVPQLLVLLRDRSASISLNLSTWGLFTVSSTISLLYACSHNGDSHFIVCSAIGFMGNLSIFLTAAAQRIQHLAVNGQPVLSLRKS